jgi:hypothetical protein
MKQSLSFQRTLRRWRHSMGVESIMIIFIKLCLCTSSRLDKMPFLFQLSTFKLNLVSWYMAHFF